jgi:Rps23 Pro-64 3,4-dihydroxylase Tpa1-like proline 4-hydroxylase
MLNPDLDRERLAKEFRHDQRILIVNIFRPEVAERVRAICTVKVPFDYVYFLDGAVRLSSAGQYLTRHRDDIEGTTRRLAYVFGFTRRWHPDWGGLLQFYEDDGTPRDAWVPAFNRLSLFAIRHVHWFYGKEPAAP